MGRQSAGDVWHRYSGAPRALPEEQLAPWRVQVRVRTIIGIVGRHGDGWVVVGASPHLRVRPGNSVCFEYVWVEVNVSKKFLLGQVAWLGGPTQWCVLERKGNNILDALDWIGRRVSREPLTDHDLDTSDIITGIPMILV